MSEIIHITDADYKDKAVRKASLPSSISGQPGAVPAARWGRYSRKSQRRLTAWYSPR